MRELLLKIMDEYPEAKKSSFAGNSVSKLFKKDFHEKLKEIGLVNDEQYIVKGSVGQGNWAMVPWICIFDKEITSSAKSGTYIGFLFSADCKSVYLTLIQGMTDIKDSKGTSKAIETLKENAKKAISELKIYDFKSEPSISLGTNLTETARFYEFSTILYKKYEKDNFPGEKQIESDIRNLLDIYTQYKIKMQGGEGKMPVTEKEIIGQIKSYIASKGFSYPDALIENFYLSLKSKPFVILAGTSGTGKTRLVKLFAEAIGAEFRLVSVRPDWSDGSDLFGHNDLNGNFIPGPVCECFAVEKEDRNKPIFLCLDEMNLARVEYYLSDFLSVIESREKKADGKIVTGPIAQYIDGIPDNLYIVGTVNMDETTFPFSKKVLDRANTIEFSFVNLLPDFGSAAGSAEKVAVDNDFLRTKYLVLAKDCADEKDYVEGICEKLEALNKILLTANAHVGYRVRDEIVFYMLNNKNAGNLLTDNEALDYEIMQKILPRIQGSSAAIKNMLIELFKYCCNDVSGIDPDSKDIGIQMKKQASSAAYPISAAKIGYMMTRYEEDGFTSYWL